MSSNLTLSAKIQGFSLKYLPRKTSKLHAKLQHVRERRKVWHMRATARVNETAPDDALTPNGA